jgi:hypothetical protein
MQELTSKLTVDACLQSHLIAPELYQAPVQQQPKQRVASCCASIDHHPIHKRLRAATPTISHADVPTACAPYGHRNFIAGYAGLQALIM